MTTSPLADAKRLKEKALKWLSAHEEGWRHIQADQTKEAREIVQFMRSSIEAATHDAHTTAKAEGSVGEAVKLLSRYNKWRRGDEAVTQPNPREIGEAIDIVIEAAEEAERLGASVEEMQPLLGKQKTEIEHLRQRIAELEGKRPETEQ